MFSQLLVNALITASYIILVAVGFLLIYRVAGFFHFAHGAVFTAGAYGCFGVQQLIGPGLLWSALAGVLISASLGCAIELGLYRRLRKKGGNSLVLLIGSLGAFMVIQHTISLAFGPQARNLRGGTVTAGLSFLGARVTPNQLLILGMSGVLVVFVGALLERSRMGRQIRAIASDSELAAVIGLDVDRTILFTVALGSAMAGVAGILVGLDVDIVPTMGTNVLMLAVVAVIVGGGRSIWGVVGGAVFIALARQGGAWILGAEWQDAVVFGFLGALLIARPEGFGRMFSTERGVS